MPVTLLITSDDRPVPPSPGRWLRGEVCVTRENDTTWGSGELDINSFYRYTVVDQTPEDLAYLLLPIETVSQDPEVPPELVKRRQWNITEAGMVSIWGAGGAVTGTLASLTPLLHDGLLD